MTNTKEDQPSIKKPEISVVSILSNARVNGNIMGSKDFMPRVVAVYPYLKNGERERYLLTYTTFSPWVTFYSKGNVLQKGLSSIHQWLGDYSASCDFSIERATKHELDGIGAMPLSETSVVEPWVTWLEELVLQCGLVSKDKIKPRTYDETLDKIKELVIHFHGTELKKDTKFNLDSKYQALARRASKDWFETPSLCRRIIRRSFPNFSPVASLVFDEFSRKALESKSSLLFPKRLIYGQEILEEKVQEEEIK